MSDDPKKHPPSNGHPADEETNAPQPVDDDPSAPVARLAHPENRPLLLILGDLIIEAKTHSNRLEALYEELIVLPHSAHPWAGKFLDEQERHHAEQASMLVRLRKHVAR